MKLSRTIRCRIFEQAPLGDRLEPMIVEESGTTVRCDVSGAERLACSLAGVELVEEVQSPLDADGLAQLAERVCATVIYLLEPLKVVELDRQALTALMRSSPPRSTERGACYYELLANANRHISLKRYLYDPDSRARTTVDFTLTPDQLESLLDDLIVAGRQ